MQRGNVAVLWGALLVLILAGCNTTPRTRAVEQDSEAGYRLGITVDEDLRVVAIDPGSAAITAGVEVGDQLVDLTWILSEAPEELAVAAEDGSASEVNTTTTTLRPPPGVEFTTVPFTAPDDIHTMISYGLPLRLQVMRAGEVHALTIIPAPPDATVATPGAPERYF